MPTLGASSGGFGGGVLSEPITANRLLQKHSPTYLLPQVWPVNTGSGLTAPQGLVALYTFNGNANDVYGNNATAVNGSTFVQGQVGLAASLNGTNQYFTANAPFSATSNFIGWTLVALIKRATTGVQHSILESYASNGTQSKLQFTLRVTAADQLAASTNNSQFSGDAVTVTGATIPSGAWYVVAGTYDAIGGILSGYAMPIGSCAVTSASVSGKPPVAGTGTSPLKIGARGNDNNTTFGGQMQWNRVYAAPLSQLALQSICTSASGGRASNENRRIPPQLIVLARGGDDPTATNDNEWRIPLRRMIGG